MTQSMQQKSVSTTPPPPSDDQERYEIHKATLLSLALHKTAKIAEEQEKVPAVKEKILEEDVEKLVEGEDNKSMLRSLPILYSLMKKTLEEEKDDKKDDDDDNDDHDDQALIRTRRLGSLEDRTRKMQTLIPSLSHPAKAETRGVT
ncbi:hypothetical protein Tco_1424927 [Tanacetum coccineum]